MAIALAAIILLAALASRASAHETLNEGSGQPKPAKPTYKLGATTQAPGTRSSALLHDTRSAREQALGTLHRKAGETVAQRTKRIATEAVREVREAWAAPVKPHQLVSTADHAAQQARRLPVAPAPSRSAALATLKRKAASAPAAVVVPKASDPAKLAAQQLDAYLRGGGTDRGSIADYQDAMGVDTDGLVGPALKQRASVLLGHAVSWPAVSSTGAVPGGHSAQQAAQRLVRYVRSYGGSRRERVGAYQRVLGLAADGIVGPKTKAKVLQLTGVQL